MYLVNLYTIDKIIVYTIFLFSLIELQSASPIHTAQKSPVMVSEMWNRVHKNIIAARAKIARKAQCSRYLYLINVHFLTNITVKLLTNIAPIPNHNAMMKIFLLNANAPMTPSKEKLASKTSKYKNSDSHILWILVIHHFGVCNNALIHSITTKVIIHRIPAIKNER